MAEAVQGSGRQDLLVGLVPWLRMCNRWGLLREINGVPFDLNSLAFWVGLLEAIALRRGMGEALADGGWQAAHRMGLGVELMRRYYTGWGYAGHWDGHAAFVNRIVYPFWLVGLLVLYPLCLWYGRVKGQQSARSVLRFV